MQPSIALRGSSVPRAWVCVSPINLGLSAGDHCLLDIRSVDEEFCHGSSVAVSGDAPNGHFTSADDDDSHALP